MTYYLRDLLPRLKKYSAELDHSTFLVDKPWVVSGEEHGPFQKLIFRRDGRVHLSNNGNLTDGKWEYLPEAKALIIDYGENKKLFRHEFLDESVLALKVDGHKSNNDEDYFLLSDENRVPDSNAKLYLRNKYLRENNLKPLLLSNGKEIYIKPMYANPQANDFRLLDENGPVKDGVYYTVGNKSRYVVKNGQTLRTEKLYKYPNGIYIWQEMNYPQVGEEVEGSAEGSIEHIINYGTYKIDVRGSRVVKATNKTKNKRSYITIAILIVLVIAMIYFEI